MRIVLKNFRLVDEETDAPGSLVIEDGIISSLRTGQGPANMEDGASMVIDGRSLCSGKSLNRTPSQDDLPVLMPAFVDIHAHFRDPVLGGEVSHPIETPHPMEVLESASLAAVAGGFVTVVCMANTKPPIDDLDKAISIKKRSDALALIDLYPVMSLTKGMEGRELSGITSLLPRASGAWNGPLLLSEDGRDIADDALFLAAMEEARRIGIPISCHCDFGGDEAERAKAAGLGREVWSRIEENNAVNRVIRLGRKAGCHIHIAHVSTMEAVSAIREAKTQGGFPLTCEVMPHNLSLTEEDANYLGRESWGRVNFFLRAHEDRKALIRALADGTIDAIATDHAPHSSADKERGAPGFSALETAFSAAYTELVRDNDPENSGEKETKLDLKSLSSLMSARPARLLTLHKGPEGRGRLLSGYRADLVIADLKSSWIVKGGELRTRGKNTPFEGKELFGRILMTLQKGRPVYVRSSRI